MAVVRWVHPARADLSGALNTVQHHDMHHRYPTRHFSLYFTHWDRWCGTEHPAYCEQVPIRPVLSSGFSPDMPLHPDCCLQFRSHLPALSHAWSNTSMPKCAGCLGHCFADWLLPHLQAMHS